MSSWNAALLKRVPNGLCQQWDHAVPGSLQSQEGPFPHSSSSGHPVLQGLQKSQIGAKLDPLGTCYITMHHGILGRERKRCPFRSIQSLFHGAQATARGRPDQSHVQLPGDWLPFCCLLCLSGLKLIWTCQSMDVILRLCNVRIQSRCVLVLAEVELIFFPVAGMVLCFGLRMGIMLITHCCFNNAVLGVAEQCLH